MKLEHLREQIEVSEKAPPREAAELLIYMPPSGSPVECPPSFTLEDATEFATRFAARHPGSTVAVYALVGTTIATPQIPSFAPHVRKPSDTNLDNTAPIAAATEAA